MVSQFDRGEPVIDRPFVHAGYLDILQPLILQQRIDAAVQQFQWKNLDFDSLAFTGASGLMFGPMLATALCKNMIMVRKPYELAYKTCHSPYLVEGYARCRRYVIVDDCVATGSTARHIIRKIRDFAPEAKLVNIYSYGDIYHTWADDFLKDWRLTEALYESVPKIEAAVTIAELDDPTVADAPSGRLVMTEGELALMRGKVSASSLVFDTGTGKTWFSPELTVAAAEASSNETPSGTSPFAPPESP